MVDRIEVIAGDQVVAEIGTLARPDTRKLIVIDGDLRVAGNYSQSVHQDDDAYRAVLVTGNMSAANVCLFGDSKLLVQGDLEVEGILAVHAASIEGLTVADVHSVQPLPGTRADAVAPLLDPSMVGEHDDDSDLHRAVHAALAKGREVLRG